MKPLIVGFVVWAISRAVIAFRAVHNWSEEVADAIMEAVGLADFTLLAAVCVGYFFYDQEKRSSASRDDDHGASTEDVTIKRYPLLFSYRDLVEGRGFVAGVEISGRALLFKEDDGEVAVYSVSPGGLGGIGGSRRDAMADFRDGYRTVLYDLAAEARDFEEFRSNVERLVAEESDVEEWMEAVEGVRAGRVDTEVWREDVYPGLAVGLVWRKVYANDVQSA